MLTGDVLTGILKFNDSFSISFTKDVRQLSSNILGFTN